MAKSKTTTQKSPLTTTAAETEVTPEAVAAETKAAAETTENAKSKEEVVAEPTAVSDADIPGPDFTAPNVDQAEASPAAEGEKAEAADTVETAAAAATVTPVVAQATIAVPLSEVPPGGYMTNHVEVRLSHDQTYALRGLFYGLREAGECLAGGKPIASNADVVRWLLEQVAAAGNES